MLCMDYVWIYMAHTSILMGQPLTRMHPYGTGTKPHRNQIRTRPVGIHNILLIFWEKRDSFISLVAQFDYTMLHRFIISKYPGPGVNPHFFQQKKTWSGYHATATFQLGDSSSLGTTRSWSFGHPGCATVFSPEIPGILMVAPVINP